MGAKIRRSLSLQQLPLRPCWRGLRPRALGDCKPHPPQQGSRVQPSYRAAC
jgi:hypothetical protein|eukprot:SAG25_NODE_101_length_15508_cov_11.653384_13_plen_51_part_00